MKTIALIHPAIDFEENYPCSWIPYSVLSLAGRIPATKFQVEIYDEHKMKRDEIFEALKRINPFAVGVSIMTGGGQISRALIFAKYIKKHFPECYVIFGGPHVNVLPEQTIENKFIDFALAGPGQEVFVELLSALSLGNSIENIDGVYYKEKGLIHFPPRLRASISNLDSYNYSLINPDKYIRYDATISNRTVNYITSQGCPYACNFCYECSYRKKYYTMEEEKIYQDISFLVEQFGINGIKFYDADFFINTRRCGNIIKILKKFNLAWAASIHPNDILHNYENGKILLKDIKNSNCKRLLMGMESGNDRVLKEIINKHVTSKQLFEVAEMIGNEGILGSYTFMVGYPDETEYEQDETFDLIKKLWSLQIPIETKVHIYLPYPGTPLYDRAIELGFKPPQKLEDWSDFNYYKAMTPWTNSLLEKKVAEYTKMICKNNS